jgi:hypothetical protein
LSLGTSRLQKILQIGFFLDTIQNPNDVQYVYKAQFLKTSLGAPHGQ